MNAYRTELYQGLELSSDPDRIDVASIHGFLSTSYWAAGIPLHKVRKSLAGSLVFGAYRDTRQVAFARFISDRTTFAYLCDVFVLPEERQRGLGKALLKFALEDPDLQGLRRIVLVTQDAQEFYRPFGFTELAQPDRYMELWNPRVYEAG